MFKEVGSRAKWKEIFFSVGFIAACAFAVRLIFLCHYLLSAAQPTTSDDLSFGYEAGAIAAAIAQGKGFSSPLKFVQTGPTAWFTPIYPYLLAAIFKCFGVYTHTSSLVIRFVDNAFSACTCWPIYAIGAKAFSRRVGAMAAWIWVCFPMSVVLSTVWVWDTALSTLMLTLVVAATLHLRGSVRVRSWIGYGALWATGSMVNPVLLSILPALALWALWPQRRLFVPAARLAAVFSLMFVAGITPWTIRNYAVFHQFIPFRSNFGLELWLGNNPLVPELWSPTLHPNNDRLEAAKYARMGEIPYMQEKEHQAVMFIRSHPIDALRLTAHRFSDNWIAMWDSPADLWKQASLQMKLSILGNFLFTMLSVLGVWLAYRQRNEAVLPLASVMLFFPLVFYVTHTAPRYRHPMDPILLVLAVYALAYGIDSLFQRIIQKSAAHKSLTDRQSLVEEA